MYPRRPWCVSGHGHPVRKWSFQRSQLRKEELVLPYIGWGGVEDVSFFSILSLLPWLFFFQQPLTSLRSLLPIRAQPFTSPLAPSLLAFSHLLPGFISSDWSSCQSLWHGDELHCYNQPGTRGSGNGNERTTTVNISPQGHNGESLVPPVCVFVLLRCSRQNRTNASHWYWPCWLVGQKHYMVHCCMVICKIFNSSTERMLTFGVTQRAELEAGI